MIETVAPSGAADASASSAQEGSPTAPDGTIDPSVTSQPMARLYVEPDGTGVYVYRLVDTTTGRVLAEAPRDRLHELTDLSAYEAGALVSTCV